MIADKFARFRIPNTKDSRLSAQNGRNSEDRCIQEKRRFEMGTMPLQNQFTASGEGDAASDDLIYHITHDLRAPVRALGLLPDWIEEDFIESGGALPSVVGMHLDTIREQTQLLDRLILDLRDYSRIGRLADPASDVDLHQSITKIVAELPESPKLSLKLDLQVGTIKGPSNDITMLLRALLVNSLQHHDQEQACVSVSSKLSDDTVSIEVTDDGPGIEAEQRERAFGLLTTLYRRDDGAGSGVGLALAKRVVENLNGTIRISDNPAGRGIAIQIALPADLATPEVHRSEPQAHSR